MVFLALPCAGSLPPSECSKAPTICALGSSSRGPGCLSRPLPLPGGGSSLTGRCAVQPVGVAARRRAPSAVNNGAGREEKGNLLGEAVRPAGGRASERVSEQGRREFTFAPVSARRGRRRRGRRSTKGADRPAPRSRSRAARGGIGARPRGAEPASLASEGNHGGRSPGGPPEQRRMPHEDLPSLQRPRYGCECSGSL